MTEPKPGDEVRGWVKGTFLDGGCVAVGNCHVPLMILRNVEILPPPEPDWQPGDKVLDRRDGAFVRTRDADTPWRWMANDRKYAEDYPIRPLRRARIVPEDGAS